MPDMFDDWCRVNDLTPTDHIDGEEVVRRPEHPERVEAEKIEAAKRIQAFADKPVTATLNGAQLPIANYEVGQRIALMVPNLGLTAVWFDRQRGWLRLSAKEANRPGGGALDAHPVHDLEPEATLEFDTPDGKVIIEGMIP